MKTNLYHWCRVKIENMEDFCPSFPFCPLETIKNQKPRADSERSSWSSTADSILCPDRGDTAARDIKMAQRDCCPLVTETSRHIQHQERLVHLRLQKNRNLSEFVLGTTFCLELSKMEGFRDCSCGLQKPGCLLLTYHQWCVGPAPPGHTAPKQGSQC